MGGVTDVLLQAARDAEGGRIGLARKAVEALHARHAAAARALGVRFEAAPLRELSAALEGVSLLRERTARVTDLVSSFGERLSAPLLAATPAKAGVPARAVDARELLVTDDRHGAATCDRKRSDPRVRRRLRPLLAAGILPVVTGFIARSAQGETTTLGRSGSDTTAALLGAALRREEVVIWTDVDGVLSADPRLVRGARLLPRLSYREAAEMTFFGAKVLHFPAVLPAIAEEIPLVIRNSFRPDDPGTTIAAKGDGKSGLRAVTAVPGCACSPSTEAGMTGIPGIAARVFSATARLGVSVVMFSQASSEQNIALVIPEGDRARTVAALEQEFRCENASRARSTA